MPELTVVVSGSRTEVGKTWVAARLLDRLRAAGAKVSARKPVQSFSRDDARTDAEVLAEATGEDAETVTPEHRWYALPIAPPMAAEVLGEPEITIQELVGELDLPEDGICIIEGVGGPRSPVADNGDTVSLARATEAHLVVVVCDPGLGAINDALLSSSAFNPRPTVVFLNRFDDLDDLHVRNREWLSGRAGRTVFTSIDQLVWKIVTMVNGRAERVWIDSSLASS